MRSGNYIDTWFTSISTSSNVSCSSNHDGIGTFNTGNKFSKSVSGLSANRTYYYRSCGRGYDKTNPGALERFKTLDGYVRAKVETRDATNIGQKSVRLNGYVLNGKNIETYFAVSEYQNVTCGSGGTFVPEGYDTGESFYSNYSSLKAETTYYYRACGQDSRGVVSGARKFFKTIQKISCGQVFTGSSNGISLQVSDSRYRVAHVKFNAFQIPDRLDIYHSGGTSSTNGLIAGSWGAQFALNGGFKFVVTGNSNPSTQWQVIINCYQ